MKNVRMFWTIFLQAGTTPRTSAVTLEPAKDTISVEAVLTAFVAHQDLHVLILDSTDGALNVASSRSPLESGGIFSQASYDRRQQVVLLNSNQPCFEKGVDWQPIFINVRHVEIATMIYG